MTSDKIDKITISPKKFNKYIEKSFNAGEKHGYYIGAIDALEAIEDFANKLIVQSKELEEKYFSNTAEEESDGE